MPTDRRKRVRVDLTLAQAEALANAAGNVVEYDDAMRALFRTPGQRKAAENACTVLGNAIREAKRTSG